MLDVAKVTAVVGLGLGTVLGLVVASLLQPSCREPLPRAERLCQPGLGVETVGEVGRGACGQYVCFHKYTGERAEDDGELRGCIILIKVEGTDIQYSLSSSLSLSSLSSSSSSR